jgi:cyclic beta-1,2-glucan synthetase
MLSAAYALAGVHYENGEVTLADDAFEAKGELQLESIRVFDRVWTRDGEGEPVRVVEGARNG